MIRTHIRSYRALIMIVTGLLVRASCIYGEFDTSTIQDTMTIPVGTKQEECMTNCSDILLQCASNCKKQCIQRSPGWCKSVAPTVKGGGAPIEATVTVNPGKEIAECQDNCNQMFIRNGVLCGLQCGVAFP